MKGGSCRGKVREHGCPSVPNLFMSNSEQICRPLGCCIKPESPAGRCKREIVFLGENLAHDRRESWLERPLIRGRFDNGLPHGNKRPILPLVKYRALSVENPCSLFRCSGESIEVRVVRGPNGLGQHAVDVVPQESGLCEAEEAARGRRGCHDLPDG